MAGNDSADDDDTRPSSHERFMRRCIAMARAAGARGDTPVGALIVRDGRPIAGGGEQTPTGLDITAHAEIVAIRRASRALGSVDLRACTLYTTAEPCFMCSHAIRDARIWRVVMGARTPNVGCVSSAYPILSAADITPWAPRPQSSSGMS